MEVRTLVRIKNHSIQISNMLIVAVFTIAFVPCILSSVFAVYVNGAAKLMLYWGTAGVLVLLAVQQQYKLFLPRRSVNWLFLWTAIWVVSIFRNGDIERESYGSVMMMLAVIIIAGIISAGRRPVYNQVFTAMELLLIIQLLTGTFFLIHPEQLVSMGTSFYHLEGVWLSKFNHFARSNYFMGFVTHYSTSGMYMAWATILLFAECVESKFVSGKMKKWKFILFALFGVALVATQKRAHLLFSGIACMAMYFVGYVNGNVGKRIRQMLVGILVTVLIVVLIINISALSGVVTRFLTGDTLDEAFSGRIYGLWIPAWTAFKNNWGLGIGWGRFKWLYPNQQGTSSANNNVHNIYLQLFCENGILFGSLIIALLLYTYVMTWRSLLLYKKVGSQTVEYLPILFSFGYQTFFLLYGLTGNPLYDIETLYPYMICSSIAFRYTCKQHKACKHYEDKVNEPRKGII